VSEQSLTMPTRHNTGHFGGGYTPHKSCTSPIQ